MDASVDGLTQWFALVAAGGGAIAALYAGWRWAWKRASEAYRWTKARLELLERELTTNGGSSLKDQVARLEETTSRHMRRLEANDRRHEKRFEKVEREVAQLRGESDG